MLGKSVAAAGQTEAVVVSCLLNSRPSRSSEQAMLSSPGELPLQGGHCSVDHTELSGATLSWGRAVRVVVVAVA